MHIITDATPAITAATQLDQVVSMYAERPLLLMLSGGSALTILEHVNVSLLGPHVTITTLDERFSMDPAVNNFAQIAATHFYRKAVEQGVQTIATVVGTDETLSEAGERFDTALHHWKESQRDGAVVTTMGVGADGHTAGIFPHQPGLDTETADWVVAYEVPPSVNPYTMRITVTPTFLKTQVAQAICLITGKEKRNVLQRMQRADCALTDMPACVMHDMPLVTVVTDIH